MEQPISNTQNLKLKKPISILTPCVKEFEDEEDDNIVSPKKVRYETLSWIDREFKYSSDSLQHNIPISQELEESNPNEIKVIYNNDHINEEKLIEINNKNNTMDNKKKNQYEYVSKTSFKNTRFSDDSSSSSSPKKNGNNNNIPEIQNPVNQQYSYYGTFSNTTENQYLNYESLSATDFNDNKLFKDGYQNEHFIIDNDNKIGYNGYQSDKENLSPIAPSIETNITNANETTPLTIFQHSVNSLNLPNSPGDSSSIITFFINWTVQCIKFLPAVLLGVLLNLLDSLSYGIIIFPKHESMPSTYVQSGISMFLVR